MKWGVVLAYGLDVRYGSSNVHRSHTRDTTDDSGLFILDTYNPSTAASYREEELAPPSDTREMPPGGGFQPCLHCSFMDHGQVAACRFLNILGTLGNVRTLIYSFMEEDARCYRTRGGVIYCTILKRARRFCFTRSMLVRACNVVNERLPIPVSFCTVRPQRRGPGIVRSFFF